MIKSNFMTVNVCFTSQELILYFVFIFHREFQVLVSSESKINIESSFIVFYCSSRNYLSRSLITSLLDSQAPNNCLWILSTSRQRDSPLKQWNSPNKQSSERKYNLDIKLFLLLLNLLWGRKVSIIIRQLGGEWV